MVQHLLCPASMFFNGVHGFNHAAFGLLSQKRDTLRSWHELQDQCLCHEKKYMFDHRPFDFVFVSFGFASRHLYEKNFGDIPNSSIIYIHI